MYEAKKQLHCETSIRIHDWCTDLTEYLSLLIRQKLRIAVFKIRHINYRNLNFYSNNSCVCFSDSNKNKNY